MIIWLVYLFNRQVPLMKWGWWLEVAVCGYYPGFLNESNLGSILFAFPFLPYSFCIFFSILNLKAFQLDMLPPVDHRLHDLLAQFLCSFALSPLEACELPLTYSLWYQAGNDLGMGCAAGVCQESLEKALKMTSSWPSAIFKR